MVCLFVALALASPPPTPGPLARAGAAADQLLHKVARSVEEALLESKVKVALLEHLGKEALAIEVEAAGHTVILSGTVRERASVMVAEQVARAVPGVEAVKNLLKWQGRAGEGALGRGLAEAEQRVADQLLEARVKLRLLGELGKTALSMEVEASSGVVVLAGTVPDETRKKLARSLVESTPGVREVHDLLRVAP